MEEFVESYDITPREGERIIRPIERDDHDMVSDAFDDEFIGLTLLANALSARISFVKLGRYYRGRPGRESPWDIVSDVFDSVFSVSKEDLSMEQHAIISAHERFATAFPKAYARVREFCCSKRADNAP